MNIFTLTALALALVLVPIIGGAMVVIRQDATRARRDDRWLNRQR